MYLGSEPSCDPILCDSNLLCDSLRLSLPWLLLCLPVLCMLLLPCPNKGKRKSREGKKKETRMMSSASLERSGVRAILSTHRNGDWFSVNVSQQCVNIGMGERQRYGIDIHGHQLRARRCSECEKQKRRRACQERQVKKGERAR